MAIHVYYSAKPFRTSRPNSIDRGHCARPMVVNFDYIRAKKLVKKTNVEDENPGPKGLNLCLVKKTATE